MASAFNWRSAWQEYDPEEDPEVAGIKHYPLEGHATLYKGDHFWDSENRFLIKITSVKTKLYTGVVAPAGEEGDDAVFYECLYDEPRHPEMRHGHWTDDIQFMTVDDFTDALDEGRFVPHRGNGLWIP